MVAGCWASLAVAGRLNDWQCQNKGPERGSPAAAQRSVRHGRSPPSRARNSCDPDQTGFIKGRSIKDNVMLAELFCDRQVALGEESVLVLCDMTKAYDSCHRPFLFAVMEAMGLPAWMCRWARMLHSNTCARLCINGSLTAPFLQSTGVRQGCPWAPLLFDCLMEALACYLKAAPGISGFLIPCTGVRLILSMYADDLLAFLPPAQLPAFFAAMSCFAEASCLRLSLKKTKCLFVASSRPSDELQRIAAPYSAVNYGTDAATFLGFPLGPPAHMHHLMHIRVCSAIAKLQRLTDLNLKLPGRSRAAASYAMSALSYFLDLAPADPTDVSHLQHALFDYVANNQSRQRVRVWRMPLADSYSSISDGGLGVINVEARIKAARLRWFARFVSGPCHLWKLLFADLFGSLLRPLRVPPAVQRQLLVVPWINSLLPQYPLIQGGDSPTCKEFMLSQPVFNNPLITLPDLQGTQKPLNSKASRWRVTARQFPLVRALWDAERNDFLSFPQFLRAQRCLRDPLSKYTQLLSALHAAWPHASAAPSHPNAAAGLFIAGQWTPTAAFTTGAATAALLPSSVSRPDWWLRKHNITLPNAPSIFRRILRSSLLPAAKQTTLFYCAGALSFRYRMGWLLEVDPAFSTACPLCEQAADDPVHFPAFCTGLATLYDLCGSVLSLANVWVAPPPDLPLVQYLCSAAELSDSALLSAAVLLHLAWRHRCAVLFHDTPQAEPAAVLWRRLLDWLLSDLQAYCNQSHATFPDLLLPALQAAGLVSSRDGTWHLDYAAFQTALLPPHPDAP